MPAIPAICFIILRASSKRSSSLLTSETVTPEPRATRALRDAFRILGCWRSCGVMRADDRHDAVDVTVVDLGELLLHLPHAGQHAEQVGDRAHLPHLQHLVEEVLEREVVAGDLGGHLFGLRLVERLLGLLDEGEDVTHAEDARRHPLGVEDVEVGELLTGGREHDRPLADLRDRQGRTTAGVTVELGEHDAGEVDAFEERLGGRDGVLADHRVDDEEHLVGMHGVADVGGLLHQLGVDAEPAGGVDDDDVVQLLARPRSIASRATATGSPTPLPGSGA